MEVVILKNGKNAHNNRREVDARDDLGIGLQILEFIERYGVNSVVMVDRIIGCPHEEGVDYPDGEVCPQRPFWANRDRWTGDRIQ